MLLALWSGFWNWASPGGRTIYLNGFIFTSVQVSGFIINSVNLSAYIRHFKQVLGEIKTIFSLSAIMKTTQNLTGRIAP